MGVSLLCSPSPVWRVRSRAEAPVAPFYLPFRRFGKRGWKAERERLRGRSHPSGRLRMRTNQAVRRRTEGLSALNQRERRALDVGPLSLETKRDAGEERCGPRGPGRQRVSWRRLLLPRHSPLRWGPGRQRGATAAPCARPQHRGQLRGLERRGPARLVGENLVLRSPAPGSRTCEHTGGRDEDGRGRDSSRGRGCPGAPSRPPPRLPRCNRRGMKAERRLSALARVSPE